VTTVGTSEDARLDRVLAMPDVAPVAAGRRVVFAPELAPSFVVHGTDDARVGPSALASTGHLRSVVRHALEIGVMRELCPEDDVLAGLMASRTAALFANLENDARTNGGPWREASTANAAPSDDAIAQVWSVLLGHQPGAPAVVLPGTARRLRDVWQLLGPAEYLIGTGGDTRIRLDPATGLNAYGCGLRPRPWAITFASSTASSISERGYAGAEAARRRLLRNALHHGADESLAMEARATRRALVAFYDLPDGTEVVLTPSGTDGELCALAVSLLGDPARPLANVLVAPEESGTGVPLAATGRHFATLTARGIAVTPGDPIEGFPTDTRLVTVSARTHQGAIRATAEVDAECTAKVASELAAGRRVLLHRMDQTKTGLIVPGVLASVAAGREGEVDVVVDACQARVSVASVRGYLARDFMVLVTGSKFFTGPAFSGALLLPPRIAARLFGAHALPAGLAEYSGRFDWPETAPASAAFPRDANAGLVMRWSAALAEMEAFASVGEPAIKRILARFGARVRAAIAANPDLSLHAAAPISRPQDDAWDVLPTIFTFSLYAPGGGDVPRRRCDVAEAKQVCGWLNADLSQCLPPGATDAERVLAARHVHLGQPVALAMESRATVGAVRLCAGARLVSGEPSQSALDPAARIEREIDDALAALAKISLVLKYLDVIRAANPRAMFQG
jgi:selenocysteine lyase/cysteine desulfurase